MRTSTFAFLTASCFLIGAATAAQAGTTEATTGSSNVNSKMATDLGKPMNADGTPMMPGAAAMKPANGMATTGAMNAAKPMNADGSTGDGSMSTN